MSHPRGAPKTPGSGRKKGTPNKVTGALRERIEREADPIGLLIDVVKGKRFKAAVAAGGGRKQAYVYPSIAQRKWAAHKLANKILPDVRAVKLGDQEGGDIVVRIMRYGDDASS